MTSLITAVLRISSIRDLAFITVTDLNERIAWQLKTHSLLTSGSVLSSHLKIVGLLSLRQSKHIGRYPLVSVDPGSIPWRATFPPHFPPLPSVDLAQVRSLSQLFIFSFCCFSLFSPSFPLLFSSSFILFPPLILFSSSPFTLPSFLPFLSSYFPHFLSSSSFSTFSFLPFPVFPFLFFSFHLPPFLLFI